MASLTRKIIRIINRQISMLLEPIIGYSRMVSLTKKILVVTASILILILVILPFTDKVNKNYRLTFSSVEKGKDGESPKMINPHLQGVDTNNQTYNITAETAVQDKMQRMTLKNINADINLTNQGWLSITAEEALYDHIKSSMDLKGNISIFNNEGYEFYTTEAYVDIKNKAMYGNNEISGQGVLGNIRADRFQVENNGDSIKLMGRVKMILFVSGKNNQIKNENKKNLVK